MAILFSWLLPLLCVGLVIVICCVCLACQQLTDAGANNNGCQRLFFFFCSSSSLLLQAPALVAASTRLPSQNDKNVLAIQCCAAVPPALNQISQFQQWLDLSSYQRREVAQWAPNIQEEREHCLPVLWSCVRSHQSSSTALTLA